VILSQGISESKYGYFHDFLPLSSGTVEGLGDSENQRKRSPPCSAYQQPTVIQSRLVGGVHAFCLSFNNSFSFQTNAGMIQIAATTVNASTLEVQLIQDYFVIVSRVGLEEIVRKVSSWTRNTVKFHLKDLWWYITLVELWESDTSRLSWGSLEKDNNYNDQQFSILCRARSTFHLSKLEATSPNSQTSNYTFVGVYPTLTIFRISKLY